MWRRACHWFKTEEWAGLPCYGSTINVHISESINAHYYNFLNSHTSGICLVKLFFCLKDIFYFIFMMTCAAVYMQMDSCLLYIFI